MKPKTSEINSMYVGTLACLTASTMTSKMLLHAPIDDTGPKGPHDIAVLMHVKPIVLIILPTSPIQNRSILNWWVLQNTMAKIKTIKLTANIADIERVVPLNFMLISGLVRYLNITPFEQKVTGVSKPKSTGIQIGSSSPSLRIFGASLFLILGLTV